MQTHKNNNKKAKNAKYSRPTGNEKYIVVRIIQLPRKHLIASNVFLNTRQPDHVKNENLTNHSNGNMNTYVKDIFHGNM